MTTLPTLSYVEGSQIFPMELPTIPGFRRQRCTVLDGGSIDRFRQLVNDRNASCTLPTFWGDDGTMIPVSESGCKASDFDQYGDMEAFGVHPDWQRQLSKFPSVQDRLREWQTPAMDKIICFSCLALDFDAIRVDKPTQVTLDAISV